MKVLQARFARAVHSKGAFPRDGLPEVAFVGRSNVGKSSLLNKLIGRKQLARTSSTPGRTRSINYYLINDKCYFVDLPGYGYARAAKSERQAWARLIESYFERGAEPQVVQLIDAKVGATPLDIEACDYLAAFGTRPLVVATKIDKVPRSKRQRQLKAIREALRGDKDQGTIIGFSAQTGEGLRELWKELDRRLERQRGAGKVAGKDG